LLLGAWSPLSRRVRPSAELWQNKAGDRGRLDATTRHGILKDVPMGSLTADELAAQAARRVGGLVLMIGEV